MKKYITYLFTLYFFLLNYKYATANQEYGYVVGRVIVELDGYQGEHKTIAIKGKVIVGSYAQDEYGDYIDKALVATCNEEGFFYLENIKLSGDFRLISIEGESGKPIQSIIPSPRDLRGDARILHFAFSNFRDSYLPIVNIGTSVIVLNENGQLGFKYSVADRMVSFDLDKGYHYEPQEYNITPVIYYANNGSDNLKRLCESYAKDRNSYLSAKPFYLSASELQKNHKQEAIEKLNVAIKTYKYYTQAYILLSQLFMLNNEASRAEETLLKGINNLPDELGLYVELSSLYSKTANEPEAVKRLQLYKEGHPEDIEVYKALATIYYNLGETSKIEQVWHEAIHTVKNVRKYIAAGIFYTNQGEMDKAIFYFQKYYEERSSEPEATIYLANSYIKNGQVGEALSILGELPLAITYFNVSNYARQIKNFDLALELCKQSLEYISDKSLGLSVEEVKTKIAEIENMKAFEGYWANYLKKIQVEGDYTNWKGKPYDLYNSRK
ncbi:MAG: hypothetical protein KQI35_14270 [Bacteroidetes bacterium]|nr:hypothetical protein [Bacteroidota bacterium]